MKFRALFLPLIACVSACHLPNPSPRADGQPRSESTPEAQAVQRDESLVAADAPGTIRVVEGPLRGIDGVTNGKAWLLELYQNTLNEKTELARKFEATDRDYAELRKVLEALKSEHTSSLAEAEALDRRVRELEAQTLDLAQRLAHSEIARLEFQKSELEREAKSDRMERPR